MGYYIFPQIKLNIMNFFDGSTALKAGVMAAFFFSKNPYLTEI